MMNHPLRNDRFYMMPTLNHIVEALCDLEIIEYQPAYIMAYEDNNDLRGRGGYVRTGSK